jgi:hypothetical protein
MQNPPGRGRKNTSGISGVPNIFKKSKRTAQLGSSPFAVLDGRYWD